MFRFTKLSTIQLTKNIAFGNKYGLSRSFAANIDSSSLVVKKTDAPVAKLPNSELLFGKTFTDHMLEVDWSESTGWETPIISPLHNLQIDPAASCIHSALECFEGMKAYKDKEGKIRMFRPELNIQRLQRSMQRLQMPTFSEEQFLKCMKELLRVDSEWIPSEEGYSLYLRPTAIATHASLVRAKPAALKMFVICSPVGPYYPEGFKPITLYANNKYVRAWPGGTGNTKLAGNYAPTIQPQTEAMEKGFTQVLWLFGDKQEVTEVGTMNIFFLWRTKEGDLELITPELDGTILPGITRQSIIDLVQSYGEFKVTERKFYMDEVVEALEENRVVESFGCGTAAIVTPIKLINYNNIDYDVPIDETLNCGKLTKKIWQNIVDIQYGNIESDWSVVVEDKN